MYLSFKYSQTKLYLVTNLRITDPQNHKDLFLKKIQKKKKFKLSSE